MPTKLSPRRAGAQAAALAAALLGPACAAPSPAPPATPVPAAMAEIEVSAGTRDRLHTPVHFALPGVAEGTLALVAGDGTRLPLQVGPDGQAAFILPQLTAGQTRRYRVVAGEAPGAGVRTETGDGELSVQVDGQPVLTYHSRPTTPPRPDVAAHYSRGGYLHPVRTPAGRVLTADYSPDHVHHHGIWAAWTNTVFEGRTPDFWNMGKQTGTVVPVAVDRVWSGPVHGGIAARHQYLDLSVTPARPALDERWTVRAYDLSGGPRPLRVFDVELVQTTAGPSPLELPEYRYGGLAIRGRDEWLGASNSWFLTSEGKDRSNGHATRGKWVHLGGYIDGELAGVGILAHPTNFRFPEPLRIHPTEPYVNWAPSQAGPWSIQPGTPQTARYRFVTYDGPVDPAELDRLWADYAEPPTVTLLAR